jgi:geranylgeranyl diphosphate/geranylgeranyl-bacteriochlorophyllide a reductase
MCIRQIAIVGGGPAGAVCGERLARAGLAVTIYDEHLAWEKPCGGGLTHKAIVAYPFLLDAPYSKKLIHTVELISSRGQRARLDLDHPIVIYSRAVLNGLLLERAAAAGCRIVRSHVARVDTSTPRVRFHAGEGWCEADFIVIAAGARNALLLGAKPLARRDLEMTIGYFIPSQADAICVKFLRRFEGYIWSFPRSDHLSVGICGSMARHTARELRRLLEQFLSAEHISSEQGRFYSHVLPSPQAQTLRQRRLIGPNWALVGDAAALVDPITGEGLYYALRSGDLLAETLIAQAPECYPARLRGDFSTDLEFGARVARRVYGGRFLGAAVTTRMVQFIRRSDTFRTLMSDLFSGAQNYSTLKRRLWSQFGLTAGEVLMSLLKPRQRLARQTAGDA